LVFPFVQVIDLIRGFATTGVGAATGVGATGVGTTAAGSFACVNFTFSVGLENVNPYAPSLNQPSFSVTVVEVTRDSPESLIIETLAATGASVNP
jgi:hypothetical protein